MSNSLKAYVRRTLLAAARDYSDTKRRTPESTRSALTDALRGTDTGWWSDLIYTAPMLDMAHRYRRGIALALEAYRDETGEGFVSRDRPSPEVTAESILTALVRNRAWTFEEYREGPEGRDAEAALLGLRFAVEWYAGEIARELCPDL